MKKSNYVKLRNGRAKRIRKGSTLNYANHKTSIHFLFITMAVLYFVM
ncbi:hypothetical protein Q4601_13100 [Shewanella sp. 1_MG-2023]|uniref:Uncharacterized protein n=1 Tax=Shewanella electrodiphila TaxID=934143 RepID=A0ABT0KSE4_9GAMM|nr:MULTISPECIES: hypothetical protein [Shewanella]MCC4831732.1 hypothetical protein [Shewanella sp. 10N.7]MCL1046780.1 hypothetical protein [Shewanella electrodiphila]MDO6612919.1 hypothetical protein [Shewanella sp. 7_MG-2023]MDO6772551.1 hypothetical protein [Shewanella sp. 2_MG-2023]MDO6795245.1 hypothetical protein [Shewanella sp. 1_MG-2023]